MAPEYRGRFAPSPTGPLHFGSLVAAVGSFLHARHAGGRWLLRMEDVDRPRCVPGAATAILGTLERYCLHWDGEVTYQSRREEHYRAALATLLREGLAYGCACSRRETGPGPYPGTCRNGPPGNRRPRSTRLLTDHRPIAFDDEIQGSYCQDVEAEVGDFVLRRTDGLFAYNFAVVVDDAAQGVTAVVRGADLLDSTPRQIHLQRALGLPTPVYAHLPVAVSRHGRKLGKQTRARSVDLMAPESTLHAVLVFLGLAPPAGSDHAPVAQQLAWATHHFGCHLVPRSSAMQAPEGC